MKHWWKTDISTTAMINKYLNWPHTDANGLAPWYLIVWRALWFPVIYLGWGISYIGIAAGFGLTAANSWIQDVNSY